VIKTMQIKFTETAIKQLEPYMLHKGQLKLVYDTEGCGCAVNGVAALWLVDKPDGNDLQANGDPYPVAYSPKDEVFFEELLKIDYQNTTKSFILKSNSQIYNASMSLIDKRKKVVKA
jgi:uncharacterized protein YqkB